MCWEAVDSLKYLKEHDFLPVEGSVLDKLHDLMLDLSKKVIKNIFSGGIK